MLFILFVMPIVSLFTLCALFAEPRVVKAQATGLEGDSRRLRNCRHVFSPGGHGSRNTASLLADAAAVAAAATSP